MFVIGFFFFALVGPQQCEVAVSSTEESQISGSKSWIFTNPSWRILESSFWWSSINPWPRYSPAGTMSGSDVARVPLLLFAAVVLG